MPILPKYFFKGKVSQDSSFLIPAQSRALRYGDGLFETILCAYGQTIAFELHLERMLEGMKILQFDFESAQFSKEIKDALLQMTANVGKNSRARIRISVFRAEGGAYLPISNRPEFWIEMQPITDNFVQNDLTIGFADTFPLLYSPLSQVKSMNALPYIMAAKIAQNNRWDDAILSNNEGEIAECTASNIFWVKNKDIFSPPLRSACLPGTMRARVILAAKKLGLAVHEQATSKADLATAEEIFLTNAIQGIRAVAKVAETSYESQHFPICAQIRAEFKEWS